MVSTCPSVILNPVFQLEPHDRMVLSLHATTVANIAQTHWINYANVCKCPLQMVRGRG